jgi:hypothetical protein
VYLQGDYHLVSPCLYLDVSIKQKNSSSPLRLLLPQVRISRLLFCGDGGPATPNQIAVSSYRSLTALTSLELSSCKSVTNEVPRSSLDPPPLELPQRIRRGEAGAAHRHPQPDRC